MDLLLIWCITATVAAVTSMMKTASYYLKDFHSFHKNIVQSDSKQFAERELYTGAGAEG